MIDLPESKVRLTPTSKQPRQIKWWTDWVLLVPVALVLAVDQISKYFVKSNLMLGESWPREGIFRITYGTNSGSIFGLFPNQTGLLIVASFVAIGFLVYFYKKHALSRPVTRLSVGLLLGGAFGNLIDRVSAGTVVDFIDLGWWPIFNMADSSIVVGIILLVSTMILSESKRYDHPDIDMSNKTDE